MKFAFVVSALASVALAQTCDDVLKPILQKYVMVGMGDQTIGPQCADTAAVKAEFQVAIETCGQDYASPLKALMELICEKDPDSNYYCFDGFRKLIPWLQLLPLAQGGGTMDFKFIDSFTRDNLDKACANPYCARKYTEVAIDLSKSLPAGAAKDTAFGYAKDLASACAKSPEEPDTWCAEQFKSFFSQDTFQAPTKEDICKDGEVRPCIQAAVSQRLVFDDYSAVCAENQFICDQVEIVKGYTLDQINSLCGSDSSLRKFKNEYKIDFQNIPTDMTLEKLKSMLLSDLVFNLHDTKLDSFRFNDANTLNRRLLVGDSFTLVHDSTTDQVAKGCSDFIYPTMTTKMDTNLQVDCSVSYPDGYTLPPDRVDSAPSTSTAVSFIVASIAAAFTLF